ncbi:M16 family metallopeptidase [Limimaricola hongkongensis]|uniref:Peptidase, M16 family n=1 Tax=Limimaricola hongkongensis DSM 17492 TaxID=1122180 RepID=A0A017HGT2_9RHOB|nr:pitrilysin family protein [Limimaricola hongkongensis]EYD73004.1 Peptidase, M16 family [Limimaricola hongkongensis DSM 17492]
MLRRLALAAPVILAVPAMAQDAAPASAPDDAVTTYTLDNGLEVVVIEDHRAPVVTQMLWYRVGSADEPEGASGVAHFLEHLLFKATDDLASGEFSATVAANGGTDNAFTSTDYTAYFQRVAADRLPLMMEMEAERMNDLRLTDQDIETERQVIVEERNQRVESNPGALAREQMNAAQYINHPYGRPVIGWMHEIEGLGREDVRDFYETYYSPNDAILVVAGDVEPEEVLALAEAHYGPIPAEPELPERIRPQEPPQRAARSLVYADERVSQPYLTRSYLAPERDAGDQRRAAALTYLARILGGSSFTSVLSEELVFEREIALHTGAGYDGMSLDDTTFSLSVVPKPGVSLGDAEAALDEVLTGFLDTGPSAAQMQRIRTQLGASEIYARDSVEGLARRYGAALSQGLTVEDVAAWPEILQSVTAEEVVEAARAVFDPDQSTTLRVVRDREEEPK